MFWWKLRFAWRLRSKYEYPWSAAWHVAGAATEGEHSAYAQDMHPVDAADEEVAYAL